MKNSKRYWYFSLTFKLASVGIVITLFFLMVSCASSIDRLSDRDAKVEQIGTPIWFDELPVLGQMPPLKMANKLLEMGDTEDADRIAAELVNATEALAEQKSHVSTLTEPIYLNKPNLTDSAAWISPGAAQEEGAAYREWEQVGVGETLKKGYLWWRKPKAYEHTSHAYGYFPPGQPSEKFVQIKHAGNIEADSQLINRRINVKLDRIRVADYPGGGEHLILFDFYAKNQLPSQVEHLHFNMTYRGYEGERVAVIGYPIFIGLNAGHEGLAFKCFTINIKNKADEAFLDFLESDVARSGLHLLSTAQPAIAPFANMAVGLVKGIATRNKNVPVQDVHMGLDFSNIRSGARLAQGSYIAVQIPETMETIWDWSKWVYNPSNGLVVNKQQNSELIPFNYFIFSISKYKGT